jgi:osmotically-inducible protein OsmY
MRSLGNNALRQPNGIKDSVEKAFVRNAEIDGGKVKVASNGTTVTLSGSVSSYSEKDHAGIVAWNAPGVNSVLDEIAVT